MKYETGSNSLITYKLRHMFMSYLLISYNSVINCKLRHIFRYLLVDKYDTLFIVIFSIRYIKSISLIKYWKFVDDVKSWK